MKYFIVNKGRIPVAVVGHSYLKSEYSIKSKSKAFYDAFCYSVNFNKGVFRKINNELRYFRLDVTNPSWSDIVLKRACCESWSFSEYLFEGDFSELVKKILKN